MFHASSVAILKYGGLRSISRLAGASPRWSRCFSGGSAMLMIVILVRRRSLSARTEVLIDQRCTTFRLLAGVAGPLARCAGMRDVGQFPHALQIVLNGLM